MKYTLLDYQQWLIDNYPEHYYEYLDEFEALLPRHMKEVE